MSDPIDVVERQISSYLARDLDGFLACYAPEIKISDSEGNVLMDLEGMREQYGTLFRESANLTGRIANRIVVGGVVVDEEEIHGLSHPEEIHGLSHPEYPSDVHAAVAYHVTDDKIDRVVFLSIVRSGSTNPR